MKGLLIGIGTLSLLSAAGIYFWQQYSLLALFQFDLKGVSVLNFNTNQITLRLKLKATSKSKVEFQVSKLNVQLYINGEYVGTAYQGDPQNVPAMGYNYLYVDMLIENNAFLMQLMAVAGSDPNRPLAIRTTGTCSVKSGFVKVSTAFDQTYSTTLFELLKGSL